MQTPAEYRKYAEECERIARESPPEHRAALRTIAKAWQVCAEEAERREKAKGALPRPKKDGA
jgi:hypothetical protein